MECQLQKSRQGLEAAKWHSKKHNEIEQRRIWHTETDTVHRNKLAKISSSHGACRIFFRAYAQMANYRVQAVQMCSVAVRSGSAFDQQTAQQNTEIRQQYQGRDRAMAGRDTISKQFRRASIRHGASLGIAIV